MKKMNIIIITLLFIFLFPGCSLKYQRELVSENNIPQITFENLVLKQYADNKKNVELKSSVYEIYKNSSVSFAKDAAFNLYDDENKNTSSGNATLISADSNGQIFTLYDGLEFFDTEQNIRIKGDTLKWNGKTEQLVSAKNGTVSIQKDDLLITGKDFSASAVSNSFLYSGNVQGQQLVVSQRDGSKEKITFSGDSMQGNISNKKDSSKKSSTVLSGNAVVRTSTMEIKADTIELTGDDFNIIKAKGNISGTNSESELKFSSQTLEYNQDTKLVVLSGDVELKDEKNGVVAKAQVIEYDQNTDVAVMQIDVELKQKSNVCTSAYSIYRKKEQTLELSGNASVKQSSDTFRAQYIKFDMETEEIVMDGNIRGSVTTSSSENK